MHIGILQADSVLPDFQADFGNYPGMIERMLANTGEDIRFTTFDVEHGGYPSAIDDCDGYVITGSKKSVYDDEPWIYRLRDYVVELDQSRTKTVGICFGHQMIAHALGGRTESANVGWGVGVHRSRVVRQLPFMEPTRAAFNLLVSHKDQVTLLPPDAELLATSEHCPIAMYVKGNHMFAFQGHPEFCKDYSKALIEMRAEVLGPETVKAGLSSLEHDTSEETIARWIINFIKEGKDSDVANL